MRRITNPTELLKAALPGMLIIALLLMNGCKIARSINSAVNTIDRRAEDAIHSLDNAIATLAQESADWRVVVANLEKEISADVQSTIRVEIQDMTHAAILSAGAEFRCNADYLRLRVRKELIEMRNNLAETINAQLANTPFSSFQIPLMDEEPEAPYICDAVPAYVDLSLDPVRRKKIDIYGFDLRSGMITVSYRSYGNFTAQNHVAVNDFSKILRAEITRAGAIKEIRNDRFEFKNPGTLVVNDISSALSIISDYHAVLDLTGSGVDLPPNAKEIIFLWDGKIQSEIPILIYEPILECNITEKTVNPGTHTFIPPAVENSPYGGQPDKEFNGHGPCVTFNMHMFLNASRKKLSATVNMDAWECPDDYSKIRKDYTQALGSKTITIIEVGEGETIQGYSVSSSMNHSYIDTDHQPDVYYFGGNCPIDNIEFVGDTKGSEAGTKTQAKIEFRSMKIQVEKCEYK